MPRNGVSWVKKAEPKFIREFKERIAYKEQASLEAKKKKPAEGDRPDMVTEEKEEDRPQIVQLRSGDLGEKEYNELRDKEVIQNSFCSSGKIQFKKRPAKIDPTSSGGNEQPSTSGGEAGNNETPKQQDKVSAELDAIFKTNEKDEKEGEKNGEEGEEAAAAAAAVATKKKIYLEDESAGEQPPIAAKKSRLVDRLAESKAACSLTAAQVKAREAKAGNRKLLSFYDEEEEENEEYRQDCLKSEKNDNDEDDDDN